MITENDEVFSNKEGTKTISKTKLEENMKIHRLNGHYHIPGLVIGKCEQCDMSK